MATRYNYTGQLITDGLVLNLDAAKRDSYPGSGTTWYDLSGNGNNGTLTNGPTYTGVSKDAAIVFDGVDDYVNWYIDTTSMNTTQTFTFEIWFKYSGGNEINLMEIGGNYNDWSLYIDSVDSGKPSFSVTGTYGQRLLASTNCKTGSWFQVIGVYNQGTAFIYVNGNLENSGVKTLQSKVGIQQGRIGTDNNLGDIFKGNISNTKIYNRALTQSEITQNFNALRGRYGI